VTSLALELVVMDVPSAVDMEDVERTGKVGDRHKARDLGTAVEAEQGKADRCSHTAEIGRGRAKFLVEAVVFVDLVEVARMDADHVVGISVRTD
jgi:hypothetical protein